MPPDITPMDVAGYAPGSPMVSADACVLAQDWAAWLIQRSKVDPALLDARQLREVKRAECAYALYASASGVSASSRASISTASAPLKSVEVVGEIKIERFGMTAEQSAASAGLAADTWLQRARSHLRAAGISVWQSVVGASR